FPWRRERRQFFWLVSALLLVTGSALIDRSSTLFYFVPVTAALWPRRRWSPRSAIRWLGANLGIVGLGLVVALLLVRLVPAWGWREEDVSAGMGHSWWTTLGWFLREPLP